jgi:acetylornithine aminotransferase
MAGARDCSAILRARRICTERGIALISMKSVRGRPNRRVTAAEPSGLPDLLTLAKGLPGDPIAPSLRPRPSPKGSPWAISAARSAVDRYPAPRHWRHSTFSKRAAAANARRVGAHLAAGALALGARRVWGRGLRLGFDFGRPARAIQHALFAHRILTGTSADPNVLRLLPPLSFTIPEADRLLGGLREVLA